MRVLLIKGDEYAAMNVEQEMGIKEAINLTEAYGGTCIVDRDGLYAEMKILDFGDVDPAFVSFICDEFMDYDYSKSKNFYVIN